MAINYDALLNPDTAQAEIANVKDTLSKLETANASLTKRVADLQDTNQKLFLQVSSQAPNDNTETEHTEIDVDGTLTKLLL